jgi:hypothetical protein
MLVLKDLRKVCGGFQGYRFLFTGHSLGAAVAQIAAVHYAEMFAKDFNISKQDMGGYYLSVPHWISRYSSLPSLFEESHHINHYVAEDVVPFVTRFFFKKQLGIDAIQDMQGTSDAASARTRLGGHEDALQSAHFASRRYQQHYQFDPLVVEDDLAMLLQSTQERGFKSHTRLQALLDIFEIFYNIFWNVGFVSQLVVGSVLAIISMFLGLVVFLCIFILIRFVIELSRLLLQLVRFSCLTVPVFVYEWLMKSFAASYNLKYRFGHLDRLDLAESRFMTY